MRFMYYFIAVLLLSSIYGVSSFAEGISSKDKQRLELFLKRTLGTRLPEGAKIEVKGYEKSDLTGFKKGSFAIQHSQGSGEVPFLISQDGKYLVFGEPIDTRKFADAKVSGLKQGEILVGRQQLPVLMSKDGKYMVLGELIDSEANPLKETMDKISLDNVPVKGDKNAKVTVVEYSDFQCPFCSRASDMLPKILEEYKGKVKIFYKQFPLPSHDWADEAAAASVCTYQQGGNDKFWKFHDLVFNKQKEITSEKSKEQLLGFAKQVGVDGEGFEKCLDSADVAARVQREIVEGQSVGINSTPTFVVNGLPVPGADYAKLKEAIDANLSGKL